MGKTYAFKAQFRKWLEEAKKNGKEKLKEKMNGLLSSSRRSNNSRVLVTIMVSLMA